MKIKLANQQGFTITELLVAISVGSILSILMISIFIYGYGGLLVEQTRANMVLESQLFLRRITEDIRVANQVLPANTIVDSNDLDGWTTSDPANILILTQPAIDNGDNFIIDSNTGYPYQNEIIYFGDGQNIYRRTLENTSALGNVASTTCSAGTVGCSPDIKLSEYLKNMTFIFYDTNDTVTTSAPDARSVSLTINLGKNIFGRNILVQNTTRMTLRNENQ